LAGSATTRDGDILDAAIEVLAEVGYDRMTML
jgi:AcrR family transcriptional regulator